jgi:methyl-accepting chemotaxis protein
MQKNMGDAIKAVGSVTGTISEMKSFIKDFTEKIADQLRRVNKIAEDSKTSATLMDNVSDEIGTVSANALSVTQSMNDSAYGTNEIAHSTSEMAISSNNISRNAESASVDVAEISRTAKEMTLGLTDISKSVHYFRAESDSVEKGIATSMESAQAMLAIAGQLEKKVLRFKTNGEH